MLQQGCGSPPGIRGAQGVHNSFLLHTQHSLECLKLVLMCTTVQHNPPVCPCMTQAGSPHDTDSAHLCPCRCTMSPRR